MRDEKVTQSEFAARTGLSRQRVSSLVANGTLPKIASGKIPWVDGLRALIASLGKTAAGRGESPLSIARTRLADAQREAIELKNRALQDEWVLTKEVNDRWIEMCITFRNRMLGVVNELPQLLTHLTRHDLDVIDRVIRDGLTALADEAEAEEGAT